MRTHTNSPVVDDIDRISRIADPVIRNLQITQCYYELSRTFSENFGPSANWCTFATWASKQAGQSIRREDLIRAFEYQFRRSPEISLAYKVLTKFASGHSLPTDLKPGIDVLLRTVKPEEIFGRVSDAIALGNKKVFEEIGRVFADFLAKFRNDPAFDPVKISDFCSLLRTGEPPEGQGRLREAFTTYYKAHFTNEPKAKDELLFFANLLVGYHEQIRLQPEIAEALNAPVRNTDIIKDRLLKIVLPGFWIRLRHKAASLFRSKLPLDLAVDRLTDQVQSLARKVTTNYLMTLQLAEGEVLHLGRDLEGPFSTSLKVIKNPQLKELLNRVDQTPDSLRQSGAADWSDFDERMHFITDFFRAYHDRRALFNPPFTDDQVKDLKSGKLPKGPL